MNYLEMIRFHADLTEAEHEGKVEKLPRKGA